MSSMTTRQIRRSNRRINALAEGRRQPLEALKAHWADTRRLRGLKDWFDGRRPVRGEDAPQSLAEAMGAFYEDMGFIPRLGIDRLPDPGAWYGTRAHLVSWMEEGPLPFTLVYDDEDSEVFETGYLNEGEARAALARCRPSGGDIVQVLDANGQVIEEKRLTDQEAAYEAAWDAAWEEWQQEPAERRDRYWAWEEAAREVREAAKEAQKTLKELSA